MKRSGGQSLISLLGINKNYRSSGQRLSVLENVDLAINHGESCAILGESGSGKSTLLNIIGLLDAADSGRYYLGGHDMSAATPDRLADIRNRRIGFVFQSFNLMKRLNAVDNVALPLRYRRVGWRESQRRAMRMLEKVGLGQRALHKPADLSGGQRQRVAIARALVGEPDLILADEPTGNLDGRTASEVMDMLLSLNHERRVTLVVVTHDPGIAACLDRQIRVEDGAVKELGRRL